MENYPNCPKCNSEYTYEDGSLFVCPECAHEWSKESQAAAEEENVIRDVNGNILNDGDAVTVVKDLKVKGASSSIKIGTKVKSIRLVPDAADGHEVVKISSIRVIPISIPITFTKLIATFLYCFFSSSLNGLFR